MPDLLSLPPEILLDISDHLPPDAILSLKLTHPILNNALPLGPLLKRSPVISRCSRLAIRTYLTQPEPVASRIRCVLCKAVYPASLFNSGNSPACLPVPYDSESGRKEVVELPQRFCAWHVTRLARVVHVEPGVRNEWVSKMEQMCMHCGSVQAWKSCGCGCPSCGTKDVRTYTRYLDNKRECRTFLFWRDEGDGNQNEGQLFVRETCWEIDKSEVTTYINLPVRFEDLHGPLPLKHSPQ